MSMLVFTLIIILATLGTAFLSSIFGMLGGLILMGILVSIMPVSQAMVLHGLIQLTSNGYRAWLNRKDINWSIVATLIVGNIIALAGLVFVAFVPDRITVLLALGLLPYIAWALPKNAALDVTKKPIGLLAGMVVVATNLLAGVGGPLLDVFFQRVDMTRHQVVGVVSMRDRFMAATRAVLVTGLMSRAVVVRCARRRVRLVDGELAEASVTLVGHTDAVLALAELEGEYGAHYGDARYGVGPGHERRVQLGGHLGYQLVAEEARQGEDEEQLYEFHGFMRPP